MFEKRNLKIKKGKSHYDIIMYNLESYKCWS